MFVVGTRLKTETGRDWAILHLSPPTANNVYVYSRLCIQFKKYKTSKADVVPKCQQGAEIYLGTDIKNSTIATVILFYITVQYTRS